MDPTLTTKPLVFATRDEVDVTLDVVEGKLPDDIYGYVFFNSPCGTINSEGLPLKEHLPDGSENPEFGAPVFNGDAMLMRFDLSNPGQVKYKTKMLKPPCWYADEATAFDNEFGYDAKKIGFKMLGIGRTSFKFGSRNQLNTAINPFKFPGDAHTRMTANFDMGRPWEIDVETMELKTPIGTTDDWIGEVPSVANYPFPLNQATAHPCFDPVSQEFFTVNYTKKFTVMFFYRKFADRMTKHHDHIEEKFHEHVHEIHQEAQQKGILHEDHSHKINDFYHNIDDHTPEPKGIITKTKSIFWKILDWFILQFLRIADFLTGMKNRIFLLRWDGNKIDKWVVIDKDTGKYAKIDQCMHQNNLSKDYIVLSDSAFKFSAEIMITNPFPHNDKLDNKIRDLTSIAQLPYTPMYIIKRSDLAKAKKRFGLFGPKRVPAKRVVINLETVHFSIDYENPNDKITIHTAHNAASCAAEWVRPYDTLSINGSKPQKNTIGLMTCGEMDIGRVGKIVVDANTGEMEEFILHSEGLNEEGELVGPHTWAIALHTHRDIISATTPIDKIRHIYWQAYGTDPRYLTQFIEGLYKKYDHRIIPVEEIIELNKKWLPYCLSRENTETMQLEDGYNFGKNQNLRSMQFIPRKRPNGEAPGIDTQMDGYIMCTMVIGDPILEAREYAREVWLFDAADLKSGPVCKLSHPEMNYAFTIHSAWIEEAISQNTSYQVDINQDLQNFINKMRPKNRKFFTEFMQKHVYPNFS